MRRSPPVDFGESVPPKLAFVRLLEWRNWEEEEERGCIRLRRDYEVNKL